MPASNQSRRSGTHHNHSSHGNDGRRGNGRGGKTPASRPFDLVRLLSENADGDAPISVDEALRVVSNLTPLEYQCCIAVNKHKTILAAAKAIGRDRGTVSKAWNDYGPYFAVVLEQLRPALLSQAAQ